MAKSLINHTITCPYCGHRVLHKNLNDHIRRIHPDLAGAEVFYQTLKKTMQQDWWDTNKPCQEPDPISDGMPVAEVEAIKRSIIVNVGTKKRKDTPPVHSNEQCTICGWWVAKETLSEHIATHRMGQPLSKGEVHCPECGLNIHIDQFSMHMRSIHPGFPRDALKRLFKEYQASKSSYQEAREAPQEDIGAEQKEEAATHKKIQDLPIPPASKPYSTRREADIFCPLCGSALSARHFFAHLAGSHPGFMEKRFGKDWFPRIDPDQLFSGISVSINYPVCHDSIDHLDFYHHASSYHANTFLINE